MTLPYVEKNVNEDVSVFMMRLAGAPKARMSMKGLGKFADSPLLGGLREERRQAVEGRPVVLPLQLPQRRAFPSARGSPYLCRL